MSIVIENVSIQRSSFWAVTGLVSGTCIGGGMLVLPVQTAESGFFLTFLGLIIAWSFMTFTGLLLVEATLWVKNEAHFSSLARILIGKKTRLLSLLVYLLMNYASLVAYTAGGSALIGHWITNLTGITLPYEVCCVLFTTMFGSLLYAGAYAIGKFNLIFMIGLCLTYLILVSFGIGKLNPTYLSFFPGWHKEMGIFSMILATFSYQMVVPSLCSQLNYDAKSLKKAIIFGTTIPFAIYSLWVCIIHGIVPLEGPNGLKETLTRGASITEALRFYFDHWSLTLVTDFFGLFAIVTSYIGLSLALFYFLKDLFNEMKISMSKNVIILTSLIPTLLLSMLFPTALLLFLDNSGGFGDTVLSGLIPIAMVWRGRYSLNMNLENQIFGGKWTLSLAALFYIFVFIKQIF